MKLLAAITSLCYRKAFDIAHLHEKCNTSDCGWLGLGLQGAAVGGGSQSKSTRNSHGPLDPRSRPIFCRASRHAEAALAVQPCGGLAERRLEQVEATMGATIDFVTAIRAGFWTAASPQFAGWHSIRGEAVGSETSRWCSHCTSEKTKAFAYNLYGGGAAQSLVRPWCQQAQLFCDIYAAAGQDPYIHRQRCP